MNAGPSRLGIAVFACLGAALVVGGTASILLGVPDAARNVAPLAGLGDVPRRLTELSLPLSATFAAIVAVVIAVLASDRRLRLRPATAELVILGVAIEASLLVAAHRMAYAADGSVLPAAVAGLTGGVAILAAGILAGLGRE